MQFLVLKVIWMRFYMEAVHDVKYLQCKFCQNRSTLRGVATRDAEAEAEAGGSGSLSMEAEAEVEAQF